jgi:hypothetical protein
MKKIRELFVADVTRDIPPVVYFHEQTSEKLAHEVSEYIITGGWNKQHPNYRRVPDGIHEQYVRLLKAIASELDRSGGPDLPNAWISGFYGSGKSSFTKLLGLALDGAELPDGTSMAEALLNRDTSERRDEFRLAWQTLRQKIDPLAVVFDIGGAARDNEQVHTAVVRHVQQRLGYCRVDPTVADFELRLERDGEWPRFLELAEQTLGEPWANVNSRQFAEDDFSRVMSVMHPDRYTDPMMWYSSRAGRQWSLAPHEAVVAIKDMLRFRKPKGTLFLVIDEVSQYIVASKDRVDRLRAFASELGSELKGKAWLLAIGQQKIDQEAGDSFLIWAKDRFPEKLRVHLAPSNIRDVVHKRLLQKNRQGEELLRTLFEKHRPDLKLYAYRCEEITAEEFVDFYPMLPAQIDLLLQITSALRLRSARAQGDDQAIRGLLQLLGELFREQKLAEQNVGALVTLDQIYEVQHTALDSDVQASMARLLNQCSDDPTGRLVRVAKAVALLELIQETEPTTAKLVAQSLYDQVDAGNQVDAVTETLEELRRRNLLGYSEKQGYKIQSSAGEEWERDRKEIGVARETIGGIVRDALEHLLAEPERPKLKTRAFPWAGVFSDGRSFDDERIVDPRDDAALRVDFRFVTSDERAEEKWIKRSDETQSVNRIVWVCGDTEQVIELARDLARSIETVKKFNPRRESLNAQRRLLLQEEESRTEDLQRLVKSEVANCWLQGKLYFRGRQLATRDLGVTFAKVLSTAGARLLPELFPHFTEIQIDPAELLQLVAADLSGPSPKFLSQDLGILELDGGRYVPSCAGVIPTRILGHIKQEQGLQGANLLSHFGGPPYAYAPDLVRACVAGLLRGGKIKVQNEEATEITAVRDAGVRDLFEKDRPFRRATIFPAGDDDVGYSSRAKICKFFEEDLRHHLEREDHAIADAVSRLFPQQAELLRSALRRFDSLPGKPKLPPELKPLNDAFEDCLRKVRETKPTVLQVKKHLDRLREGIRTLHRLDAELQPATIELVRAAADVRDFQTAQLKAIDALEGDAAVAAERIAEHLRGNRPWVEIASLDRDLTVVREAYIAERQRLLEAQERQAEQARGRLKSRTGFSTLSAEKSHKVLRPLEAAVTNTTADAVAPPLIDLRDLFQLHLQRAESEANEILDKLLSEGDRPLIITMDPGLSNRELSTEADIDAMLAELRERLIAQLRAGQRIRLV